MFQELQSLSDANKKRILVITTIILMVIIIGIWATYFNSVVIGTSHETAPQATTTIAIPPATASGPGIWQDIKNGFAAFVNIFRKPSQYTIQPK